MTSLFYGLSENARRKLRKRSQPSWTGPMLATLTDKPFSSDEWLYERKLDGERCLAFRHGRKVDLRSRNRKTLNGSYPEIVDALERQNLRTFIVDGEIVAFEGNRTSFSRLQQRMQIRNGPEAPKSDVAVYYYVFDLLHCGAYDLTRLDLQDRKGCSSAPLSMSGNCGSLRIGSARAKSISAKRAPRGGKA